MSKKGQVSVRMCVGCRVKKRKEEMIWLAESPVGMVVVNRKKPHEGRGFYLCPDLRCLNLAKKKGKRAGFLETTDFRLAFEERFRG